MITQLQDWDLQLFRWINDGHTGWLDTVMATISEPLTWIPLYGLLLYLIWKREKWPGVLWILLAIGILITLSDQTASGLLKPLIERYRPCRLESGLDAVHIVGNHCGGKYGFASSHAANFFALATFLHAWFRHPSWSVVLFIAAALTAYSRVYLGVHYPGDVLAGALIGAGYALLVWKLFVHLQNRFSLPGLIPDGPD